MKIKVGDLFKFKDKKGYGNGVYKIYEILHSGKYIGALDLFQQSMIVDVDMITIIRGKLAQTLYSDSKP